MRNSAWCVDMPRGVAEGIVNVNELPEGEIVITRGRRGNRVVEQGRACLEFDPSVQGEAFAWYMPTEQQCYAPTYGSYLPPTENNFKHLGDSPNKNIHGVMSDIRYQGVRNARHNVDVTTEEQVRLVEPGAIKLLAYSQATAHTELDKLEKKCQEYDAAIEEEFRPRAHFPPDLQIHENIDFWDPMRHA